MEKTIKIRPNCPHCGSTGIYHWWWCNATDEYLAWMKDHKIGDRFEGKMYNAT